MKPTVPVLACLLFAASVPAGMVGTADSPAPYRIVRQGVEHKPGAHATTGIEAGDRIASTAAPLIVQTAQGSALLLNSDSAAEVQEATTVTLRSGNGALSFEGGDGAILRVESLAIEAAAGDEPGMMAVRRISPDEVRVAGAGRTLAVRDTASGTQVAVLGHTDVIRLVRDPLGRWEAFPLPGLQIAEVEPTQSEVRNQDSQDRDEAAPFWRWAAIGGGAAAAGAVAYVLISDDARDDILGIGGDDDDDDDDGDGNFFQPAPPVSPVVPEQLTR